MTCRSDEAPLAAQVAGWLAQARGAAGVEEIALGPLSRAEVAEQVTALADGPVPAGVVDELFARAEGNPFFTEQLVAAAPSRGGERLSVPVGLPGRLAELLAARAGRCAGGARAVLAGLAAAARPLAEDLLSEITGLGVDAVREGLRELAAARLLAPETAGGAHRPRHALLAEAVAAGLLPGERAVLHERTARALQATGDQALAAEVAGHWQAAGRPAEELPARVAAAAAAERVFGYAEAAAHWQRAIEVWLDVPGAAAVAGIELPRMYVWAIDAFHQSGDDVRAGMVAEEAYRRFAHHADPATAAVICDRAARYRAFDSRAAALLLIEEALRLFEQAPPSADHASAMLRYAILPRPAEGSQRAGAVALMTRALEIAEEAGATALTSRILASLAHDAFLCGQVEEGFAFLARGWALAWASQDGPALLELALHESDALLKLARFQRAADAALRGLGPARQAGLGASRETSILESNAAEALLAMGRTTEAAALIDPLTSGPPTRHRWVVHETRADIDLVRGDIDAAARRRQLIDAVRPDIGHADFARETAQSAAELALWAERPGDALAEARRALPLLKTPDITILCGRLLTAGMRACADLAEQARARRDQPAAENAVAAADDLASWVEQMGGAPFTDHPFLATIPAERATWGAERTRLAGASDPAAWGGAGKAWQDLDCPHRAAYAWWRQAQAQLDACQPSTVAAPALQAAAAAADGHEPLLAQVRALGQRARIPLHGPAATAPPPARARAPYRLTGQELAVLQLLAAGRTNAQIGAELYISPKTAGVHVSSILRKLGVTSRVQAAALAERAGLLRPGPP